MRNLKGDSGRSFLSWLTGWDLGSVLRQAWQLPLGQVGHHTVDGMFSIVRETVGIVFFIVGDSARLGAGWGEDAAHEGVGLSVASGVFEWAWTLGHAGDVKGRICGISSC